MKNWFIEYRFEILRHVFVTLCCVMMALITINGWTMIKNDPITFDDGIEEIELINEVTEASVRIMAMSIED